MNRIEQAYHRLQEIKHSCCSLEDLVLSVDSIISELVETDEGTRTLETISQEILMYLQIDKRTISEIVSHIRDTKDLILDAIATLSRTKLIIAKKYKRAIFYEINYSHTSRNTGQLNRINH